MIAAVRPFLMFSSPKVGPTERSSAIFMGAGSEPARRVTASCLASVMSPMPVMDARPLGILPWMTGAE